MLELVVIGATLAVAASASGVDAYRRAASARALQAWARARGHAFAPAPSRPKSGPRVEGAVGDVAFSVDLVRVAGELRTRVCAPSARGQTPPMSLVQRDGFARALGGGGGAALGSPALDRAFGVAHADADLAPLFEGPAGAALLALDARRGVWLASNGSHVVLSWSGVETEPRMLDVARDLVVEVAGFRRALAPYR